MFAAGRKVAALGVSVEGHRRGVVVMGDWLGKGPV